MENSRLFDALVEVMRRLRSPDGCPWDREQNFESLKSYLVEETYEVLEAMDGNRSHLCEELGDLLLQIVFQSQMASEEESFTIYDVVRSIRAKMIRRHPHVFGDEALATADAVRATWEQGKREERREKNAEASVLDGIPVALPALLQAWRLGEKASGVGFDWTHLSGVREKVDEELEEELDQAVGEGSDSEIFEELGDVLFSLANLARHLSINPEEALRQSNARFAARFRLMESALAASGLRPEQVGSDALEKQWTRAKETLRRDQNR